MIKRIDLKYELGNLLLIFAGISCFILQEEILDYFSILFGSVMTVRGLLWVYLGWKKEDYKYLNEMGLERGIVFAIVGIGVIFMNQHALEIVAIFWGITGLFKAVSHLDEWMYRLHHHKKNLLKGMEFIFEMILAFLLIFNPAGNVSHHIMILGLELILFGILDMKPFLFKDWDEIKKIRDVQMDETI